MIILGVVLILLALIFDIPFLYGLGAAIAVIGVILWILGATGRAVGGRRHYW